MNRFSKPLIKLPRPKHAHPFRFLSLFLTTCLLLSSFAFALPYNPTSLIQPRSDGLLGAGTPDASIHLALRDEALRAQTLCLTYYRTQKTLSSPWDVLALKSAGVSVLKEGFVLPVDLTAETNTAGDCALRILTLLALDLDPRSYDPKQDFVEKLKVFQNKDGAFGPINDQLMALLALEVTEPRSYDRAAAFSALRKLQLSDGGFAYFGDTGDIDLTGMALWAMRSFVSPEQVKVRQRTLSFLQSEMSENGGFISPWSETNEENACSAAVALSALCAVGNGNTDDATKILKNLLSFQREDGSFSYEVGGKADPFSTYQALMALSDYLVQSVVFARLPYRGELVLLPRQESLFADAAEISSWAQEHVLWAYDSGLMQGSSDRFRPKGGLTRAEWATILANILRLTSGPVPDKKDVKLTDVPSAKWFAAACTDAAAMGLMFAENGRFRPLDPVTREEVAQSVAALFVLDDAAALAAWKAGTLTIADMDTVSASAKAAVAAVMHEGLMVGYEGRFRPQARITREEAAKLLSTLCG